MLALLSLTQSEGGGAGLGEIQCPEHNRVHIFKLGIGKQLTFEILRK